jgi:hypothetical protein
MADVRAPGRHEVADKIEIGCGGGELRTKTKRLLRS